MSISTPHSQKYTKIWGTDNNGQIARHEENESHIGERTKAKHIENYNSNMICKSCDGNDMVVCNTFSKPSNSDKSKLATWYNADGAIAKQLDYITIDEKAGIGLKLIIMKMPTS